MEKRIPQAFELYQHFKGELYQIITLARHSESGEDMVVYQALYGDYKCYVRPLSMFMSEVDHDKFPKVEQKNRFELYRKESVQTAPKSYESLILGASTTVVDSGVDPTFMKFLDARTYKEKMQILREARNQIDDKMINNLAMSLDLAVEDGPLDMRYNSLVSGLQILERFECTRLR